MNSFERKARGCGYRIIAGIDEAGRGPLAGPVIAAAVILPPDYEHPEIRDSKKLSPRQRERLYEVIQRDAVSIGIGVVEAPVIDAVNILQATLAAMKEAVLGLSPPPDYLLIDGLNRISSCHPSGNHRPRRCTEHLRGVGVHRGEGFAGPDHGDVPPPVSPVQFSQEQGIRHAGASGGDPEIRPLQDSPPFFPGCRNRLTFR